MTVTNKNMDTVFVDAIRNNDDKMMEVLYKLHFPMVLNFIVNNAGLEEEARDIYQEGFITLYTNIRNGSFRLEAKIKTYLYSVCRRQWLDKLKEKKRIIGRIEDFENIMLFDEAETSHMDEDEMRHLLIRDSLTQLGEPCRTVLEDFYIHQMTMQQIVDKMGYTNTDNAKTQKYKCLQRLKKLVLQNTNNNADK